MQFIINHSSMEPIYEQIMGQIRSGIAKGTMKEGDALPSVRALAKDLKVSALTVKKAYDGLEQEGFIMTVHGKGSFVTCSGQDIYLEERRREVEEELAAAVRKGRSCGMEPVSYTHLDVYKRQLPLLIWNSVLPMLPLVSV